MLSRHATRRGGATSDGFTLVELVVTMSVAGVLAAIAAFGFASWQAVSDQQGTARELTSELRATAERAISEGRTYCLAVEDSGSSYSVHQGDCTRPVVRGPFATKAASVTLQPALAAPSTRPCASGDTCFYFFPRGTAVGGTVIVDSSQRSTIYTIHIEGLTSRVWM